MHDLHIHNWMRIGDLSTDTVKHRAAAELPPFMYTSVDPTCKLQSSLEKEQEQNFGIQLMKQM